jgi:Flp pilus assembly pilin Flp
MQRISRINRNRNRGRRGQTIAEYVLIIAIVVIAAIGILSIFSDTVREKIAGAASVFGADSSDIDNEMSTGSQEIFEDLDRDGIN